MRWPVASRAVWPRWTVAALAFGVPVFGALLLCTLGGVGPARAAEVDGYRERVISARISLEEYAATGAEEIPAPLVPELLRAIPAQERVVVGETEVLVDHSSFRALLTRLDVARDPDDRVRIAREMAEHLLAVERSLPGGAEPLGSDPEALAALLDESRLQARSPLTELIGDLVDRIAEAFERWQTALASSSASRRVMAVAVGVAIAALGALLAWVLVRLVLRLRVSVAAREHPPVPSGPGAPVVAAAEALPADALAYAESLAAAGRFAEAVRALFGGAARSLADAGHLTRARTRTNAELLAEARERTPLAAPPLASLSAAFELAIYGHRDPGRDGYDRARLDYDAVLVRVGHTDGEGAGA